MLWWMSGIFYSCVLLTLALEGPFLWQYFFFLISLPFSVLRALSPWGFLGLLKSFVSWLSKLLCLIIMGVHCCSVAQWCLTLCDPMDCSTPGFLVLHYLPEFAQAHVHRVGDAIQPSYPLSPSSPALNLSQHQSIFRWVGSSHQLAWVLELRQLGMFHFSSVAQLCLTRLPRGLQHARLPCPSPTPELAQTHVHWVGDAIQPSYPLSSPSLLAFNLSQHQGLFQWV